MLDDKERAAITRWYAQDHIVAEARRLRDAGDMLDLEEYVNKRALFGLGRHDDLPDYLRTDGGEPLFPDNLSPVASEERWQDAVEIGWEVLGPKIGVTYDDVHRAIAAEQQDEWEAFMASVARREKERGRG